MKWYLVVEVEVVVRKRLAVTEIKKLDPCRLAGSSKSDKPIIVKSAEDLPPVSRKVWAAYEANKQIAVSMAISTQQTVRVWLCYNCRHFINLAECEQPNLNLISEAKLIDCPRCKISKAELMGTFNLSVEV